tara:strand:- start:3741 stop:4382 length:642 start_codon:yes stop_codon:yes gene_type:complete
MSLCGATEKLVELTDSFLTQDELIDKVIDELPITPAQGQSIQDAIEIALIATDAAALQSLVTAKIKEYLPEIELPEEIKGLQSEVEGVVTDILTAKIAAEDLANDIKTLKTKYSGLDLGDIDLENIPQLLKDGALDLDNLCKKIPNFEETELGSFVLKGAPITTPKKSAIADILGIQIPEVKDFVFKIDTTKQIEEASASFANIKETVESIGL